VDAARFIFLSRKSDSHLDFDLEVVKQQSMDNPVYYVQYAHARICSLMAKAEERGIKETEPKMDLLTLLDTPEDLALLKKMDRFPDVLILAARTLSPHHVSYYLQELAGDLHRYYNVHHILNAPQPELLQARLHLFKAVAQILRNGLDLLGVSAPEKM
jgi:arginyl-tRNA synthetase